MKKCCLCGKRKKELTDQKACQQCVDEAKEVCKYCGMEFHYVYGDSPSCALNKHIDKTHHKVCEDCGCDNCKCDDDPFHPAEAEAKFGPKVYEDDDLIEFANGVMVTKRPMLFSLR